MYPNIWRENVNNKPKLRTYEKIKNDFKTEKYILLNLTRSERSYLAQLRFGNLPLRIETGRYYNENVDEKLCVLFNSGQVEDEIHFIFDCCIYNDLRLKLFESVSIDQAILLDMPKHEQLMYFFENNARQLAKYVSSSFARRRNIIYK